MKEEFRGSQDYVASEELLQAANIAIALQKPLLIKGEPGTGKTVLAQAIATAMGKPLTIWNIKSTTKAQDGLYVYDVVQRLYDSQFGGQGVDDIKKYVKLGKLGEAFSSEEQVVLLIDEIDKADLEFPNDLLWELDRMEFYIPETGESRPSTAPSSSSPPTPRRSCPTPSCAAASSTILPSPTRSSWLRSSGSTILTLRTSSCRRPSVPSTGSGTSAASRKSPAPARSWTGSRPCSSPASIPSASRTRSPTPVSC